MTGDVARVLDRKGDRESGVEGDRGDDEVGEGEGRVGEAETEGEERSDRGTVVVAVADVDSLRDQVNPVSERRSTRLTSPYTIFPGVSPVFPKEWKVGLSSRRTLISPLVSPACQR